MQPFVIERTYHSSVEKIWKAITDKTEMKKWYFDLTEFVAEPGFEFSFTAGTPENPYHHLCKIVEAIPLQKLSYTWRYDGYAGNSIVSFDLLPVGNETKLTLTHLGLETFPDSNPDLAKENFAKGWTHIIGSSLKEHLEREN